MKRIWMVLLIMFTAISGTTADPVVNYYTWAPWEPDALAAAWAIRRFVEPKAAFVSLPRGSKLPSEHTIDVPTSPYRRSARHTAFDAVIRTHRLESKCLDKLKPVIRLLELAPWRKTENRGAEDFEFDLQPLLPKEPTTGGLDAAFDYLDRYCRSTSKKRKPK